jgi:hypothetical protein
MNYHQNILILSIYIKRAIFKFFRLFLINEPAYLNSDHIVIDNKAGR